MVGGVSLSAAEGRVLAVVGESGCSKSLTALSIMQVLPKAAQIVGSKIHLEGMDLTAMVELALQLIRGNRVSIIVREPVASLNPLMRGGVSFGGFAGVQVDPVWIIVFAAFVRALWSLRTAADRWASGEKHAVASTTFLQKFRLWRQRARGLQPPLLCGKRAQNR